ncbi:hypothetical protein GEV33_005179 [Tenebrio molitor]|uniref:Uncharacterized protein n=1 Tax=Tenebrio molitor TaxID=7067 RepID=A0A8J6LF32_TENMO|nr:hypothetical protein GEV33_005179 [Tenebrio molitor]
MGDPIWGQPRKVQRDVAIFGEIFYFGGFLVPPMGDLEDIQRSAREIPGNSRKRQGKIRGNGDLRETQGDPGEVQRDPGRYPTAEIFVLHKEEPEEIQGDPEKTLTNGEWKIQRKQGDVGWEIKKRYRKIHVIPGCLRGIQDIQKKYREMGDIGRCVMADEEEIQGDTGEFVADTGTSVKYPLRYGKIQGTSREIRKVSRREIWEDILTRRYQRRYKEIQKRHWEIKKKYREIHVIPGSLRGIQDIQKRYREGRRGMEDEEEIQGGRYWGIRDGYRDIRKRSSDIHGNKESVEEVFYCGHSFFVVGCFQTNVESAADSFRAYFSALIVSNNSPKISRSRQSGIIHCLIFSDIHFDGVTLETFTRRLSDKAPALHQTKRPEKIRIRGHCSKRNDICSLPRKHNHISLSTEDAVKLLYTKRDEVFEGTRGGETSYRLDWRIGSDLHPGAIKCTDDREFFHPSGKRNKQRRRAIQKQTLKSRTLSEHFCKFPVAGGDHSSARNERRGVFTSDGRVDGASRGWLCRDGLRRVERLHFQRTHRRHQIILPVTARQWNTPARDRIPFDRLRTHRSLFPITPFT